MNGRALLVPAAVLTVVFREEREADRPTRKVAVMVVELTTMTLLTVTPLPLTATVDEGVKLVPVSVTFTTAPRAATFGVSLLKVGFAATGAVTLNDWATLVPAVVLTVTL